MMSGCCAIVVMLCLPVDLGRHTAPIALAVQADMDRQGSVTPGPALIVSGDIWTAFDYSTLIPRAETMARDPLAPRVHLVMVPNPPYHLEGDFALGDGILRAEGGVKLVYGNIGLHDTALFRELPRGVPLRLLPLWHSKQ